MKRLKTLFIATSCLLLAAGLAVASEHAEGGGHGNDWGNFAFRVINFIAFVGIIWWFAGKKIGSFFGSRRYNIENELADLETRKTEASRRLKEVEQSIANLEQERQKVLADYKAQGEALKASIIDSAKAQAAKIEQQAKATAEQEARYAMEAMRVEMADLIVDAAQKLLEQKLTTEEHEKLIDKYLTKVVLN